MQKSIELVALPRGRGKVIVVGLVEPDSAAAAAGVAAGQQLLAISDPIRAGDMWELDGKSALKYVQQVGGAVGNGGWAWWWAQQVAAARRLHSLPC